MINIGDIVGIDHPNEHREFKFLVSLVDLKDQEIEENLKVRANW